MFDFLPVCDWSFPSHPWPVKGMKHCPLRSFSNVMLGGTFGLFQMSFQGLPKGKLLCLKLSFQWTMSLQDWHYRSDNLSCDWYCGPPSVVNVHFDECFCWLQILGGGMWVSVPSVSTMCSVLLFRIASSKLQPRATISMHLNWSFYIILHIR